jgi:hypothetical protein
MDNQSGAGGGTGRGGQIGLDEATDLGIGELVDHGGTYDEEHEGGKERDGNERGSER